MTQNSSLKNKLFAALDLLRQPHLKLYKGFGNDQCYCIMGHALLISPRRRREFRKGVWNNTIELLKQFMVKPYAGAIVSVSLKGTIYQVQSRQDGYFMLTLPIESLLSLSYFSVMVQLLEPGSGKVLFETTTEISSPTPNGSLFTIISDIDDTFLISHSASLPKRLKLLFTLNAHSREPFANVATHYRALQLAHTTAAAPNPFFYVSSSEWNLYDFLQEFVLWNHLPPGAFLLERLKNILSVLRSGQNNHEGKLAHISYILEMYPNQRFILIGDDSQKDPFIYLSICANFPGRIYCVYIRCVNHRRKPEVSAAMKEMEQHQAVTCYFRDSSEALEHSHIIGLIVP